MKQRRQCRQHFGDERGVVRRVRAIQSIALIVVAGPRSRRTRQQRGPDRGLPHAINTDESGGSVGSDVEIAPGQRRLRCRCRAATAATASGETDGRTEHGKDGEATPQGMVGHGDQSWNRLVVVQNRKLLVGAPWSSAASSISKTTAVTLRAPNPSR